MVVHLIARGSPVPMVTAREGVIPMLRTMKELVLASESPRRKRFLHELGLSFIVCPAEIDELPAAGEGADEYVLRMARQKAEQAGLKYPSAWILSADTIVTIDNELLGKPSSPEEAVAMLMRLSGRTHEVQTGYCLMSRIEETCILDSRKTAVRFAPFAEDLARAYVLTGEPMDKAGSYGIQGRGGLLVEAVNGSYSNVVGLPMAEIILLLQKKGVITEL